MPESFPPPPSLEQRVAELERQLASGPSAPPQHVARGRRAGLAVVIGLVGVLAMLPAVVLASHQFGDVPNSNPFHSDISAIANAGVTFGCGGGDYCPKDVVTREQMAAFMNRLGALASNKTPVVNAAKLQGHAANALARATGLKMIDQGPALTGAHSTYMSVSLTAPGPGYAVVTASVTGREQACTTNCVMGARLRHLPGGALSAPALEWIDERGSLAVTGVFELEAAGVHTFETRLSRENVGDGNLNGWFGNMSVVFVPFGPTGATP